MITKQEIDSAKQNKIKYIIRDVLDIFNITIAQAKVDKVFSGYLHGTFEQLLNQALLRRGVYKWFAVRRDLIRFKHALKAAENHILRLKATTKKYNLDPKFRAYLQGNLAMLQAIRADLRTMCHSPRLRASDNDREAQDFVSKVVMRQWKK